MSNSKAFLAAIHLYPIKSVDGLSVVSATCLAGGALMHDRRFAICTESGAILNAKRDARFHQLRATYDWLGGTVTLSWAGCEPQTFQFLDGDFTDRAGIGEHLSEFFDQPVTLIESPGGGFPDDPDAGGPTIVSTATLQAVTEWFPELTIDEVRRRFRVNLEVGGVEPFWEDRLYGTCVDGQSGTVRFEIGTAEFVGTNCCQRCVVPTRASLTAAITDQFAQRFRQLREQHLPPWASRDRFDHFYRLSVNTTAAADVASATLKLQDLIQILPVSG